ncbi:MAG: septum formation initiator family protein [Candidatus Pacebacteria bacterium]|nr:septum formation initiator family protein [Candidatus Paceibacterota bacterium]MBP9842428.1 septum formation initiator family protein [Candidatus Paceibacterota bacterium]
MFDFYQRRKLKGFLASPFTRGFLLVLVISMGWSAYTRFQIAQDMAGRRAEAEAEVQRLKDQKAGLEGQVQYLSDDRGIEAEMRRQFDVALNNEQVVVIVEPEHESETNTATSTYQEQSKPAWYEFWR